VYVHYGHQPPECSDREERASLARAVPFTLADLAENQLGRLGAGQSARLVGRGARLAGQMLLHTAPALFLVAAIAVLLVFGPPTLMLTSGGRPLRLGYLAWLVLTGIGSLLLALSGVLGRATGLAVRLIQLARDLAEGRAACYVGRASTNRSADVDPLLDHQTVTCFVYANQRKYEISPAAYQELEALGGTGYFALYFTPRSHFLLSLEPIRSAESAPEAA